MAVLTLSVIKQNGVSLLSRCLLSTYSVFYGVTSLYQRVIFHFLIKPKHGNRKLRISELEYPKNQTFRLSQGVFFGVAESAYIDYNCSDFVHVFPTSKIWKIDTRKAVKLELERRLMRMFDKQVIKVVALLSALVAGASHAQQAAQDYYNENVSEQIVQTRCIACHVEGGVADGLSRLVFNRNTVSNFQSLNHQLFVDFLGLSDVDGDYTLQKASGGLGHVGGAQTPEGSSNYVTLEGYFALIEDTSEDDDTGGDGNGTGDTGSDDTGDGGDTTSETSVTAEEFYADSISSQIVQSRCIACHVSDGAADGLARLIFVRDTEDNYLATNQQAFVDFLALDDVDTSYLLSKASGGDGHVGGSQTPIGSDNYTNLETFLNLLTGNTSGGSTSTDFWDGVTLLTPELTLRRASLLLNGQLPADNLSRWVGEDEARLRRALLSIMEGDAFKDFLIRGANDRLLTDKFLIRFADVIDANSGYFPSYTNKIYNFNVAGANWENEERRRYEDGVSFGMTRAPLELIAYVIENGRPYTEILTADYTMLNPYTNEAFEGNVEEFADATNRNEFKPGQIQVMLNTEGSIIDFTQEFGSVVVERGDMVQINHAGILTDNAWLNRYPSTSTNRNRARSRWTYYHFLDFDIEKSAQRTQDPDALADTNNPTMNNPNCTVCHQTLDPIAGSYQNFGDFGRYREAWQGLDALPDSYKWDEDSPYVEGDTWYRTMRTPGFEDQVAPSSDNSLQWLASQIAADSRFATSAVKFWWPALIGVEALSAPQEQSDATYAAQNSAFVAQSTFINDLSESLATHWDIKETMADVLMSGWFRAVEVTSAADSGHEFAQAGTEKLLSPEELDAKMASTLGYVWNEHYPDWNNYERYSELLQNYKLAYGGIDSDGVTQRSTDITSVMSQIALAMSAEMACPIVVNDFIKADEDRILFDGISKTDTPASIASTQFVVDSHWLENSRYYTVAANFESGENNVQVSFVQDYYDDTIHLDLNLILDHVLIVDSDNNVVFDMAGSDVLTIGGSATCGDTHWNENDNGSPSDWNIWSACTVTLPVQIETSGDYTVRVKAYYETWDQDGRNTGDSIPFDPQMIVGASVNDPLTQNSTGGLLIKNKIAELHYKLLGKKVDINSDDVNRVYQLYVEAWQDKATRSDWGHIVEEYESCNFDFGQFDDPENEIWGWNVAGDDPLYSMSAWKVVITYFTSHYNFIHE